MMYILAYDISTENSKGRKRLRKVAKVCENYGQRVQKSVFEFQLDDKKFLQMRNDVLSLMNKKKDNIRIYKIIEPKEDYVEEHGNFKAIDYENDIFVI
ncbi:MAG: CRISPR-associated endonuclease Cas2 [Halanaerobiales bacterium]